MYRLLYVLFAAIASVLGFVSGSGLGEILVPFMHSGENYLMSEISIISAVVVLVFTITVLITKKKLGNKNDFEIDKKETIALLIGLLPGKIVADFALSFITKNISDQHVKLMADIILFISVISVTVLINLYNKKKISSLKVKNRIAFSLVGFIFGIYFVFVGIVGCAVLIVVMMILFGYKFSKSSFYSTIFILVLNSYKIIMTLIQSGFKAFMIDIIPLMIVTVIAGAFLGMYIKKRLPNKLTGQLFIYTQYLIMILCAFNIIAGVLS